MPRHAQLPRRNAALTEQPGFNPASELASKIALALHSQEKWVTPIPGLLLTRRTAPTAPFSVTYEPSIAVAAQGRKLAQLGPRSFEFGASRYLLTSVDLPVISRILEASEEAPYLCFLLKLDMAVVRELLSQHEIRSPNSAGESPAIAVCDTTPELLNACCRMVDLLKTPQDIPFLAGGIQREIIYRVLRGQGGARLREIATLGDLNQRTTKAIAWIRANYTAPLRVEDLAQLAGMGVSTLHHHFRALTSMSPLQYQKQLRLRTARERMLLDGMDAASAAFAVGYESASQFNREYSRYFGRPPMRDIRKLRSPASGTATETHR